MACIRTIFTLLIIPFSCYSFAQNIESGDGYDFEGNGKDLLAPELNTVFTLDTIQIPSWAVLLNDSVTKAIEIQKAYLEKRTRSHNGQNIQFSDSQLLTVVNELLDTENSKKPVLRFYQLEGEDNRGNVHFTGYFTPTIEVSASPNTKFRFPIYKSPTSWAGRLPTRREIDGEGALEGKDLELAWASSIWEVYIMQVQGSGFLKFPNGEIKLASYDGQNGKTYSSIGRYLVDNGQISEKEISLHTIEEWMIKHPDSVEKLLFINESYVFFKLDESGPTGAAGTNLVSNVSVAVDPRFIPLGSILIASFPEIEDGLVVTHRYRIITAQDTGGSINGPGHVDQYMGTGETAKFNAGKLHHYGKLWLLLPDN